MGIFGEWLRDPNLWHLNRRSVAGALGIGTFAAFIPAPGQWLIVTALAIWLRVNLPLSIVTIFITNPLTIPPFFYAGYRVGAWMLGVPPRDFHIELSLSWFVHETSLIWRPLVLGSLTLGAILGLLVYASVLLLWRLNVIRVIHRRRRRPAKLPKLLAATLPKATTEAISVPAADDHPPAAIPHPGGPPDRDRA